MSALDAPPRRVDLTQAKARRLRRADHLTAAPADKRAAGILMAATDHFRPACPVPRLHARSLWFRLFAPRVSWLDLLHERAYRMKMGEAHLPGLDVYVANEPSLVRHVLGAGDDGGFVRPPAVGRALRPLVGKKSPFTVHGDAWVRERRRFAEALYGSIDASNRTCRAAVDAADALVSRWKGPAGRGASVEIDVEGWLRRACVDAMLRAALSRDLDDPLAPRLVAGLDRFVTATSRRASPSWSSAWLLRAWHVARARSAARDVRAVLRAWVAERCERPAAQGPGTLDVLGRLLHPRDGTGPPAPSPDSHVDPIAMMLLCSHEQTASTLMWSLHLVAHSPRVQQRLHAEAMLAFDPAAADARAATGLALARNVIREALRLFPPLGFLPRECTQAQSMRDKTLDAGDLVVVSPWLLHRHRCLWARPDDFDPDRYEHALDRPSSAESLASAWLPFGLGPRACPGADAAQLQLATMLAVLVRAFEFGPAISGDGAVPEGRMTVRPARGVRLLMRRRG
jgi:cytochrome P450